MKNIPTYGFIFIFCLGSNRECNLYMILTRYLKILTKVNIIPALFFIFEIIENPLSNGKENTVIRTYNLTFFQNCYFVK